VSRLALLALAATALLLVAPSGAVSAGSSKPRIEITLAGSGYSRTVIVRVTVGPGAKPVRGATVNASASMSAPGHHMTLAPRRLRATSPGVYRATLRFVMLGQWTLRVATAGGGASPALATRTVILR
jgi:hypothetical protein